jgi:hypothetical protein
MMRLMQKNGKDQGVVGVNDLERWPRTLAKHDTLLGELTFLSDLIDSAVSVADKNSTAGLILPLWSFCPLPRRQNQSGR